MILRAQLGQAVAYVTGNLRNIALISLFPAGLPYLLVSQNLGSRYPVRSDRCYLYVQTRLAKPFEILGTT